MARHLSEAGIDTKVTRIGIGDLFVPHGGRDELLDELGLTALRIAEAVFSSVSIRGISGIDGGSR